MDPYYSVVKVFLILSVSPVKVYRSTVSCKQNKEIKDTLIQYKAQRVCHSHHLIYLFTNAALMKFHSVQAGAVG
jgi:hypothetical protein